MTFHSYLALDRPLIPRHTMGYVASASKAIDTRQSQEVKTIWLQSDVELSTAYEG